MPDRVMRGGDGGADPEHHFKPGNDRSENFAPGFLLPFAERHGAWHHHGSRV